jgi:uncharacterized protein YkwD
VTHPKDNQRALIEPLEARALLSAVAPNNYEQYLVELINRARANPSAEAARFGISLNEGLAAGTISSAAKQPLAINPYITDAARDHSQWMIDNDVFGHSGAGGSDPGDRMAAAGYSFTGSWSWGENIAWSGQSGSAPNVLTTTRQLHQNLFVDAGIAGRGHRINMLEASFREVGAGVVTGNFQGYNAVMAAEDFAYSGSGNFLTGVAYRDTVTIDGFYTPGEGIGSATIVARRLSDNATFQTTTWASGGYSLKLNPGTYRISATSSAWSGAIVYDTVVISSQNIKRDFVAGQPSSDVSPPSTTLSAAKLTRGGMTGYTFYVTYADATAVDVSDLASSHINVLGPNSYNKLATFVKVDVNTDGSPRKATFRIPAPGGYWNSPDNGTYTIKLLGGQISDTKGNLAPARTLGTFVAAVPSSLPTATATASPLSSAGGTTYTFTVKYSDNTGIRVSDINSNDILVKGPGGFSATATLLSVSSSTNGSPRTARYRINAPGGLWTAADNGNYEIWVKAGAVRDVDGNYVPPKRIGSFTVGIPL